MPEMSAKELRDLLEDAVQQVKDQQDENAKQMAKIKELEVKVEEGVNEETINELKDEISDLRGKIKPAAAAITDEDQKKAIKSIAVKAYNDFARQGKSGGKLDFKNFLESIGDQFKNLNISTPAEGGLAVASVLSMDLIEYAREYSPILQKIGVKNGLTRDFTELVLISYPSVGDGIENVAGVTLTATTEQTYASVKTDVIKVYANPRLTDEALMGTDYNVYGDLVRLIGDEISITLAFKVLYGDGSEKNGRGILSSSRIDITNITGKSFKPSIDPSDARPADYFPVYPTGVSGLLGANDKAIVDLFIDLTNSLPTKYLNGASFYMNRKTKGVVEKVRDANDNPIFNTNFMVGGRPTIKGYPVEIDDTMPGIAVDSVPIIFGDLERAFAMANGDIDYMQSNPFKIQGVTILEYNKEIFTIMQASDGVIMVCCTTSSGS